MDNIESSYSKPYTRWLLLLGVWLIYFSFGLLMTSMAPLVSPIMKDINISSTQMGSILGAWPFVYIFMAIPCGALIDRIGLRWSLLLASLIMASSGLLRSISLDYYMFIFAVAIFGIGGPLISIGAPKLIAQWFDNKDRGFAMGIYISGPSLGSIVALSITNSFLMPMYNQQWRLVILSFSIFVLTAGFIWLLLSHSLRYNKTNNNLKVANILSQLKIFKKLLEIRNVQIILLISVFVFFFNHGLNNWLPEILRLNGMSPSLAGLWASVPTATGILGSLLIPRLAIKERQVLILSILIFCAMISVFLLSTGLETILQFGLILQGAARGSLMAIVMLVLIQTKGVDPRHMGAAGGLFFTFAEIGGVTGPLTLGILLDLSGNFDLGLNVMIFVTFMMFFLLFLLKKNNAFKNNY